MNHYETVFVTVPDLPDDILKTIKSKVEKSISKEKGEVVKNDDWGVRKLAYKVKHNKKGKYIYYNYRANPGIVSDLERSLKLDERVIRFLTVRLDDKELVSDKKGKKKDK